MTGTTPRDPGTVGDWLVTSHLDLLNGLNRHLDPDAGLRDITLHADHAGFTSALGPYLDTPAGLAAILPPPPAAAPRSASGLPGTVAAIAAADPAARMALRRSPVTMGVILSDLAVRALTIAEKAHARDFARDLARDLARASAIDPTHARDIDRASARAIKLYRDLDRYPVSPIDPTLVLGIVLDLDGALVFVLDHARAIDPAFYRDVVRDLDRAHALAHQTALIVGDALGLRQLEGLAAALLDGALDDFTNADLAGADLTGRDLTGIRWSDWGTTWPPGTDTDGLRTQSQEIAPGIYQIVRPGHDDKARHHAPA